MMTQPDVASTDDLDDLAEGIATFCAHALPAPTRLRPGTIRDAAEAKDDWRSAHRELDLGGLLIAEEHGGSGAGPVEAARVAEVLTANLATLPFLSSAVLAPTLLSGLATPEAIALLSRLARGDVTAAVAWVDPDQRDLTRPGVADEVDPGKVTARYEHVIDADLADIVLLIAGGGSQIVAVEVAELEITTHVSFDLLRPLSTLRADHARGVLCGSGDAARQATSRMLATGQSTLAAEAAGGAQAALTEAVTYARERIQFGRPIGSFQAIKHLLADAYVLAESALSIARAAAEAQALGRDEAVELLELAAFYCPDAFNQVAATDIQVHGGLGFTAECDAHLFRRRAEADRQLIGEPAGHRARYIELLAAKETQA